ncbi:MAG: DUF1569 domain-containing protein [Bacteroidetes bacterium]|nr:DUF1569 domain-containing protein [Bacteroidota bacterium]
MKSVLDKNTRDELIARVNKLTKDNQPQWGSMTVYQMLKHCCLAEELYLGKRTYKRVLMGRIFGNMGLKRLIGDESPFPKNLKTSKTFVVTDSGDMEKERTHFIALLQEYEHYTSPYMVHWFFGKMTKEQVGIFSYKHTDHHLRQFGE